MIKKIHYLLDYFKYLKNPIPCLLFKFGFKKNITVKIKNCKNTIYLENVNALNDFMANLGIVDYISDEFVNFMADLNSSKEIITWAGANIYNFYKIDKDFTAYPYIEYFISGYYNSCDVDYNNRCVIDIGSNVGDSAIYFASRGADVYGYEPVKHLYDYSLKIKKINPEIENKLNFFNFGVSDKVGKINIDLMDSASIYTNQNDSYEIDVITIKDILENNGISADILKMDCEGCEFNIILNSDLSNFNDIIFEHHSFLVDKDYKLLVDKLESQGFKIKKYVFTGRNFEDVGLIHAFK